MITVIDVRVVETYGFTARRTCRLSMPSDPLSVNFRLSSTQAQVIMQGLDFLAKTWMLKQRGGDPGTSYPFRNKPLAAGVTSGTFSQSIMDRQFALRDRMKPKARAGGRMQMDWLEVRIAIFACRVALDRARRPLSLNQKSILKSRTRRPKSHPEVAPLAKRTRQTIKSLERHQKRATRLGKKAVGDAEFFARAGEWREHQRWMRMYLAFFREGEVLRAGSLAGFYRREVRKVVQIAVEALEIEGYDPPPEEEVREAVRRYARRSRQLRIPPPYYIDIFRSGGTYSERVVLLNPSRSTCICKEFGRRPCPLAYRRSRPVPYPARGLLRPCNFNLRRQRRLNHKPLRSPPASVNRQCQSNRLSQLRAAMTTPLPGKSNISLQSNGRHRHLSYRSNRCHPLCHLRQPR